MDKRGFELAIGTVVLMILGVTVLIFLTGFFILGSEDFMSKIRGYFSYSNIDSVQQSCEILINSGQKSGFCCDSKNVRYYKNGEKAEEELTCSELVDLGIISMPKMECGEIKC